MELITLDEALELKGRGVALLCMDEETASLLKAGMTLVDARGERHVLGSVKEHEGVWTLLLPQGDAAYFGRLFRDVRIDATRFQVEEPPC